MKAILTSGLLLAAVITLFTLVPLPLGTQTEGVMWIPEDSFVRAGTDGFVDRVVARSEARVKEGDPLVECSDPFLAAEIRVLEAQLEELEATYDTQRISDRVQAEITKQELDHVVARLEDARERTGELTIRSPDDGVFVLPMEQDLPGRFVPRGELMGYVLDPSTATARVVVAQADLDLVRNRTRGVKVRLAEDVSKTLSAVLLREVPAATDKLPARTLSQEGGGEIAIDPRDVLGIKAFQKIFLFDVDLISYAGPYNVGGRVYVRFDHGWEPLVWRLYRGLRQLFLRRFRV